MDFKNKLFLAPMAGVTSPAFRELCKQYGADVVVTEMVSANALVRKNKATWKLAEFSEKERPIGIQLFAGKPEDIIEAGKLIKDKYDFIDVNMGCPAKKVIKQGAGSALLKKKEKVAKIVKGLVKLGKPVTIKIRSGIGKSSINAVEIARVAEENGASAVFIHARTACQGYSGKADWKIIKAVKDAVKIPVIGNGDVTNGLDALRMYEDTGCDSIMVGRAAMGNPFVFREIKGLLQKGKEIKPANLGDRIKAFLSIQQRLPFNETKAQALYFIKDVKDAAQLRQKVSRIKSRDELISALKSISNHK